MSNPAALSDHIVGVAGAVESVTGTLVVDTGLKKLQSFAAALKLTTVAANEESIVTWEEVPPQNPGGTVKVTLYVWKGGTSSGTAGDSAVDVSWVAIGS